MAHNHRIISRAEWGAKYDPGPYTRPVGDLELWLHHSVTVAPDLVTPFDDDFEAVRFIEEVTQARFGWGMAYTTLFTPAGLIFEGLPIDRVGAHTKGHNRTGAGLVLVGNYERDELSDQQLDALAWYLGEGVVEGWWKRPEISGGHRDVRATACPGSNAYAAIQRINVRAGEPAGDEPSQEEDHVSSVSTMASPLVGYKTAGFETPEYRTHQGLDIGNGGKYGAPVYAAFAGVVKRAVSWAKKGNTRSTWAPYRTGNGVLIANPDGEGQGYNHMRPIVAVGDTVKLGQVIGYLDHSGRQTGAHLHFETWRDWRNYQSAFDPEVLFRMRAMRVGRRYNTGSKAPAPPKKPSGSGSAALPGRTEDDYRIQAALIEMGYYDGAHDGRNGPMQTDAVAAYQRSQLYPVGGLVDDGDWGRVTQGHYEWTELLQGNLNMWEGYDIAVDGDYRAMTKDRVLNVMERNHGGAYPRAAAVDAIPGRVFCRMLAIPTHP